MNKKLIAKIIAKGFVYLMIALLYMPIIVMLVYSFTASKTMTWSGFSLDLYKRVFMDEGISQAVFNTFVIALVSALFATIIGTFSAYGIYHMRKHAKSVVTAVNQITVINADIVTAIAFLLLFISIRSIGIPLNDGFATIIIAHTVITIPYVILSVMPKIRRLNPNLFEAGLDLGAGSMRTMVSVVLPQLLPSMISGFALAFTLSLDDFVIAQFNSGTGLNTISTLIYNSTSRGLEPAFRALSTLIFVTVLIVLLVFNTIKSHNIKRRSRQH